MRYPIIICLSIALLIGQSGCAVGPVGPKLLPPPPSEEVRGQLGTIGVVSAPLTPEAEFEGPTSGKGSGTAKGAAIGFFGMIRGGFEGLSAGGPGGGVAFTLGLALAPPAAVVGAVVGAIKAEPAARVEEAETTLKKALVGLKIREELQDRILQVAEASTRYLFVLIPEQDPTTPNEEISYRSLASEGIDTVFEISVPTFGLAGEGINPPLALVMTVRARLIRVGEGALVYESALEYRSGTRKFTEWAANNAEPLRDELDRAYQILAEKIVDELFLLYLPLESRADHQ